MVVRYSTPRGRHLTKTFCGRRAPLRRGLTVMELCVVIAVLALAAMVAIPLATRARENARSARCCENLKSLYSAIDNYESAHGFYPSNGWGYRWVGERGRPAGIEQPGSWVYSIMPHMEVPSWELTQGSAVGVPGSEETLAQPVLQLHCPSRDSSVLALQSPSAAPVNVEWSQYVVRGDYVSNEGSYHLRTGPGPESLKVADSGGYAWPSNARANGVVYVRSHVRQSDIADGISYTYLLGEKYVPFINYKNTFNNGHDQSIYTGADLDTNRCTSHPPISDSILFSGLPNGGARYFGSPHPLHCAMLMVDGSVHNVSFAIAQHAHASLGNRADGQGEGLLQTAALEDPSLLR